MTPNWELNERNTVVAFRDFGNRGLSREADVILPTALEILADDTPLLLIGSDGQEFNAVGLTWTTARTPYDTGPVLVGAKLNYADDAGLGEGGVPFLERVMGAMPNDEFALYGGGDFRLRILAAGGFCPDGVTGLRSDMFEQFFRLHATGADGETVVMALTGVDYAVAGGSLRIADLSDLGQRLESDTGSYYDDC